MICEETCSLFYFSDLEPLIRCINLGTNHLFLYTLVNKHEVIFHLYKTGVF